ncbi:MAG: DEAD/DEAH box helicase, partial [Myxococcota bacterium]
MRLTYDRGTLLLEPRGPGDDPSALPGALWDDRVERFRVPAHRYADVFDGLSRAGRTPDDRVRLRRTRPLDLAAPDLRPYQQDALDAWDVAGRRGLVVLPTGTGKTRVALAAIARVGRPAMVLVPTRALLHQWARALSALGDVPVGRYGDGRHDLAPLTVCTFESALRHADRFGDCFPLLVVDEAHHFASGARLEALEMCAAPARLGLTATPPDDEAGLATLDDAIGPVAYARAVSDFTGEHLAPFDHVSLRVTLTPHERATYAAAYGPFERAWTRW